jgi:hypothetical protein
LLLMDIGMTRGADSVTKGVLAAGLAQLPGSLALRMTHLNSIRPRWGGSIAEMQQVADNVDGVATINPRLRLLRGFIA